jgi:PIN domain nuclease of toxin-antitoxin system
VILLDTHVILWSLLEPERLSRRASEEILRASIAGEKIAYSPISLYEIANAERRKRLRLDVSMQVFIAAIQARLEMAPLTAKVAVCAAQLPDPFHGDPMDRIITATAIAADCVLITRDDRIRRANACKVLW